MKYRRSMRHAVVCVILGVACIFDSTKSVQAFDVFNSTQRHQEIEEMVGGHVLAPIAGLTTPPFPKDKHGRPICTKNRYIEGERQIGVASWYGNNFHGRLTASGERFNQNAYTLAHRSLPMGTEVIVENPETKAKVIARVNDCGPYEKGRIADLSRELARIIGIYHAGKGVVVITVL